MSLQILGILSLLLAVVASLLCAARLGNWRHPIMLIALAAVGLLPGAVRTVAAPREAKIQQSPTKSIEDLVHARYLFLRGKYVSQQAATAD